MDPKLPTLDREVARIAGRQHGVITSRQLLAAGLSRQQIKQRVRKGSLIRVHRGVYRVGHRAPSVEARYMAAVLVCGKGARLSGRAAALLHRLISGPAPPPEVTSVSDRRPHGVATHCVRRLDRREVASVRGIPVTSVGRTIIDIAGGLALDDLARVCHEAEVRDRNIATKVLDMVAGKPRVAGVWKLREIFAGGFQVTLSKLEREFLGLLRREGLPQPQTNRRAGGRYVDCRWPERRLTVELDSFTYHRSRHAWEQDRRREREARARGDEFRRYTYGDVSEDRALMLAELRELLA